MDESFGTRLRAQRERQQVTLATIAEQTKISLSLLEGLERDDVSHWPAGIFRRAFIRAYAHAIDLEPDVVVREFLELYPDPIEAVTTVSDGVRSEVDGQGVRPGPPIRLRFLVASARGSLSRHWLGFVGRRQAGVESIAAAAGGGSVTARPPTASTSSAAPDLLAAAHLCTELGRVYETQEAVPLLQRAAGILDAVGLIVWAWDPQGTGASNRRTDAGSRYPGSRVPSSASIFRLSHRIRTYVRKPVTRMRTYVLSREIPRRGALNLDDRERDTYADRS